MKQLSLYFTFHLIVRQISPSFFSTLTHTYIHKHTHSWPREVILWWMRSASGMKLTFDLEGTITRLHPNQLDNERAV